MFQNQRLMFFSKLIGQMWFDYKFQSERLMFFYEQLDQMWLD